MPDVAIFYEAIMIVYSLTGVVLISPYDDMRAAKIYNATVQSLESKGMVLPECILHAIPGDESESGIDAMINSRNPSLLLN